MHFSKSFDMKLQKYLRWTSIVQFQKIPTLPPWKVLFCTPPPLPRKFQSFQKSKRLLLRHRFPLGISNHLLWGGYGVFLELHIMHFSKLLDMKLQKYLWWTSTFPWGGGRGSTPSTNGNWGMPCLFRLYTWHAQDLTLPAQSDSQK